MSLSEILGHQKQMEALRRSLAQGRLHHAYLFVGPEGVGKKTVALSLAKAVHCETSEGDFCGRCAECARVEAGNHPDVRTIEPLAGKKEIGIQQIREIEKELSFRSFSGKKKIVVVDPAALMNWPAQNALLKTLEEPPPDALLILISGSASGLLPTLRSRCLRLAFGPLPRAAVAAFLKSRKGMSSERAEFLAAMTMGSLGKALGVDFAALLEKRRTWVERLCALSPADYRGAVALAEELAGSREETLEFLGWLQGWYRDLLVYSVAENRQAVCNLDMLPQIEERAARGDVKRVLSGLARSVEAAAGIQRNLNRRMVLEKLLFDAVGER